MKQLTRLTAACAFLCVPLHGQWLPNGATSGNIYYNGGQVGIGTTAPGSILEVNGGTSGSVATLTTLRANRSYMAIQDGLQITGTGGVPGTHDYGSIVMRSDPTTGDGGAAIFDLHVGGASSGGGASTVFLKASGGRAGGGVDFVSLAAGGASRLFVRYDGHVGIGTSTPTYLLTVDGAVAAREVIVTNAVWADYVFRPGYRLRPLSEVSAFIEANHHLPEIPTEAEVKEKGVSVGEMQAKLLAKIEELTLHVIRQERENRELREQVGAIRESIGLGGRKDQ